MENTFKETRSKIITLGQVEYRYDLLVTHFSDNYLAIIEAKYATPPDIRILHTWLKELNFVIRPNLLEAWETMARHYGFSLGDHVDIEGTELYPVRISAYPLEEIIRFTGFGIRKDGKPAKTSVNVEVREKIVVKKLEGRIEYNDLKDLFFEGVSRMPNVKTFLEEEVRKLS